MEKFNELKKGMLVSYSGLGKERAGIITDKTPKSVTIQLAFSKVQIKPKSETALLTDLGLKAIIQ